MKSIFTKIKEGLYLKVFIAVIFSALIYAGCKKPTEGLEVAITTASLFESPVVVNFENANAKSTVPLGDFPVIISGKDAGLVQMGSGGTNFKASGGLLALALKQGVKATATSPVVFNVYAEIPGYAPVTRTITVISDSLSVYNVKALEYASPADGTSVVQTQTALNAGTSALVAIATPTSPTLAEVSNIIIPAGTQMLDANNNVINGTTLKSNVVHYGTGSPTVAAAFPGGLSPTNVLDQNGAAIPGGVNFVTAGLLSIDMSVGGVPVKKFSKPLAIEQGVAPDLINFETGNPVKAGETIPLWSLNEQTGQWRAEGTATITEVGGKLVAKYTISHLSSWNLDWSYAGYSNVYKALKINLVPGRQPFVGEYEVQLQTANGGYLAGFHNYKPHVDFFQEGYGFGNNIRYNTIKDRYGFGIFVPNINRAKVVVYATNGTIVGQSAIFDPVNAGAINVNVNNPPASEFVNLKVDVKAKCSNKNIMSPVTATIILQNKTQPYKEYIYLEDGVIYGQPRILLVGHQYEVTTTFNGVVYKSGTFVAGKTSIDIPTGSSGFVASTSYDQTSNTITVKGSFSMVCN